MHSDRLRYLGYGLQSSFTLLSYPINALVSVFLQIIGENKKIQQEAGQMNCFLLTKILLFSPIICYSQFASKTRISTMFEMTAPLQSLSLNGSRVIIAPNIVGADDNQLWTGRLTEELAKKEIILPMNKI